MSAVPTLEERLATLEQKIDSFAKEHAEFRSVHVSRRGLPGPVGPQGIPGASMMGPAGKDGKDADLREAVNMANEEINERLREVTSNITQMINDEIRWELRKAGFIDANLMAVPGPKGDPGISNIPGPIGPPGRDGADGKSIIGAAGRDGVDGKDAKISIGSVTTGETASVTLRESGDGTQILDFILPRGERGEIGPTGATGASEKGEQGERGNPGVSLDKRAVAEIVLDTIKRVFPQGL